ncbi:MAG: tRNA threonylcarbamoyladenosine dehydratase [Clostridia bacterium]|nr:tRNA threonylcarbamoyladenosine dehydratase [Clostridia bacterium]
MREIFDRLYMLVGEQALNKLKSARVAVFGLGGVGGYAAEALCRSGVYNFTLFDNDVVSPSNINRQLVALHSTINMHKTEVMKKRMLDINPNAVIDTHNCFYGINNADDYDLSAYSYIIDAIDSVRSKLLLIERAVAAKTPIISSMGAGNRLDGSMFEIGDIKDTINCPLARIMRRELKKMGIANLKVVYSKELPIKPTEKSENRSPASAAFVTAAAGLLLAQGAFLDLIR